AALRAVHRELRAERGRADARAVESALRAHLGAVRRLAAFAFYERVLSLWHAVHLPLCVLLFSAAAIHVIAVHLY
ncbi:MAG: pyridine nucleotide-disulfide oxidoreductase, partial [Proteobacteria bacterium]